MDAVRTVLVALLVTAVHRVAAAAPPPSEAQAAARVPGPRVARTRVVVRISGSLTEERRAGLERLLRAELARHGVTCDVEAAGAGAEPPLAWVSRVRSDEHALVAAMLEVGANGWELVIVDAARGRAIARHLPGGQADAAAPEAVTSILESAVSALLDGLEVASEPVEDVVGDTPRVAAASASPAPASSVPADSEATPGFALLGAVGASVASLGDSAVFGGNMSLHAHFGAHVGVRLDAALFVAERVRSSYGDFRLQRSTLDGRLQWLLPARPFTLTPELGIALEQVRRIDATASGSAVAAPETEHFRVGGLLGLRANYPLSAVVAIDAGAHADYYSRTLTFTAGDTEKTPLATLGRLSLGADLGVVVGGW